jgi:hypothetical protein
MRQHERVLFMVLVTLFVAISTVQSQVTLAAARVVAAATITIRDA